jgi:hypothetical protein
MKNFKAKLRHFISVLCEELGKAEAYQMRSGK